jgi:hypothetical protein
MKLVICKCGELRRNRKIQERVWLVFAGRMGENWSEQRLQPGTFEQKSEALPLGQSILSTVM